MSITLPENNLAIRYWGDTILAKPIFIAISGLISSGKTTTADFMTDYLLKSGTGFKIYRTAFARAVKECASRFFDWDGLKDEPGRKLLQNIGMTGRLYNTNIWADKLLDELDTSFIIPDIVIVDDWRFPSELERIRDTHPFYIVPIRIIRPDCKVDNDISERSLTDFDQYMCKIYNSKGLDELRADAVSVIKYILDKQ